MSCVVCVVRVDLHVWFRFFYSFWFVCVPVLLFLFPCCVFAFVLRFTCFCVWGRVVVCALRVFVFDFLFVCIVVPGCSFRCVLCVCLRLVCVPALLHVCVFAFFAFV